MDKYGFYEIEAMKKIAEALTGLEQDAINRVLTWVNDRYKFHANAKDERISHMMEQVREKKDNSNTSPPPQLSKFYAMASPDTEAEKALVVSYWLQSFKNYDEFNAATINSYLKNLGYRITNITRAFSHLQAKKPHLAIQTKKFGQTQQARKMYQVTDAGKRYVEEMLKKDSW